VQGEPLAAQLALKLAFTLAAGRLCQIILRGLKAPDFADLAWLMAVVLCVGVGMQLVKEVVTAIVAFFEPVFTFLGWFNQDPEKHWNGMWDWITRFPKEVK
jgi:hypothetical protein